jgi:hypothetical protein
VLDIQAAKQFLEIVKLQKLAKSTKLYFASFVTATFGASRKPKNGLVK